MVVAYVIEKVFGFFVFLATERCFVECRQRRAAQKLINRIERHTEKSKLFKRSAQAGQVELTG